MSTKEALLKELKRITGQIEQGKMNLVDASIDVQFEEMPRESGGHVEYRPTGRRDITIRITLDEEIKRRESWPGN